MGHLELIQENFRLEGEDLIRISTGKSVMGNKPDHHGYIKAWAGGRDYGIHRIKFALLHGYLPEQVDHKNRDKGDNSSSNLRPSDNLTNKWNTVRKRADPLPRGVYRRPSGRYYTKVCHRGVQHALGTFDTPEEASRAYEAFCLEKRGEFHLGVCL